MNRDSLSSHCDKNGSTQEIILDKVLEREIKLSKNIQSKLLNASPPSLVGAEVSGTSHPARLIGGDYFDFYPLTNGKTRIVIGDVMGKGIPAAMIMILTRSAFRTASGSTQGPGDALAAMNKAIYEDLRVLKSFVTLFCADWDPEKRVLTYANAGHNLPLFINGKKNLVKEIPKVNGIMVGGLPNQVYKEESLQLEELDTIFFYTDGIIEARNKDGDQYKLERLIQTLLDNKFLTLGEIEKYVTSSVKQFTVGVPQRDDITMVLLRVNKIE